MFASLMAIGLLQNIHLRSGGSLPTRFVAPRVLVGR
jgi:rod shape determining protein RodA